jgi:hypothetical protein
MSENVVKFSVRAGTEDRAFDLIARKRAADIAHCAAIDAQKEAEDLHGGGSAAALAAAEASVVACHAANEIDWELVRLQPRTLAGVAAVLRFVNEIEDAGMDWPSTDIIGRAGWHYQLRATMAAAVEAIIRKGEIEP